MGVIVSAVEADLSAAPYNALTNPACRVGFVVFPADTSEFVSLSRWTSQTSDYWFWQTRHTQGSFAGGDGVGRVVLTRSGNDINYEVLVDGVSKRTATLTGAAIQDWDTVRLSYTEQPSSVGDVTKNFVTSVTANGGTTTWPWDNSAELDDWDTVSTFPKPDLTGGYTTVAAGYTASYLQQAWSAVTISAFLAPPGIYRRAMASGGSIATDYQQGADTPVLAGTVDKHPEFLHVNAGAYPLALVCDRSGNIVYSLGGGAESAGAWGAVQTVKAGRSYPCGCVLEPTHDLFVIDVLGSSAIAYGQRLAWNGTSFDIGSEVTVRSGDVAAERGSVVWDRGKGRLLFSYSDTSGNVQLLTSDDAGESWY